MRRHNIDHSLVKESITKVKKEFEKNREDNFRNAYLLFVTRILKHELSVWAKSNYKERIIILRFRLEKINKFLNSYGKRNVYEIEKDLRGIYFNTEMKINSYFLKIYKTTGEYGNDLFKFMKSIYK